MSERVSRMAPINNQGDGEVYTQYRQWPYNSTDMDGGNKVEGNQPNAYPGDEDAEDKSYSHKLRPVIGNYPIETGDASEFYNSNSRTGVFLSKLNLFLWPKDKKEKSNTGYTHGYILHQFERTGGKGRHMGKYNPVRLYRSGNKLIPKPYGYGKVDRIDNESLKNLINLTREYFSVQQSLPKKKQMPSFLDFYKNKFKDLFHPGDEEEFYH